MGRNWHENLAWAGIGLGLFLIVLQGTITIPLRMTEGGGPWRALVYYLSFLTIWTNIGLVLIYAAAVSGWRGLRVLSGPTARTLMAGSIFMVMAVYAVLLAPVWNPTGLARVADAGLHYLTPALYLGWWLAGPHPVRLRWGRAGVMMLYPVVYCAWIIFRGMAIDRWPYPFVDVSVLGWGQVMTNMAFLALAFLAVYLAAIALGRTLHQRRRFGRQLR